MQTDTTENNGVPRRPLQPGETAVYDELLKASPNWAARACALVALAIFAVAFYVAGEVHKARLDLEAAKDRIDVTTGAVRELTHAANPKYDHAICPAHDGHPEVDLGEGFTCPNPDVQGPLCVKTTSGETITAEAFKSRCQAGKL